MNVNLKERYVLWIRNGKIGGTSLQYALAGCQAGDDNFKGSGLITITPQLGYITEIQSQKISYAEGINSFKTKYLDIWENSFKFILVRNPYDRFVSAWKYFNDTKNLSFEKYVNLDFSKFSRPLNYHYIREQTGDLVENDSFVIDYILRFENFQNDFNRLCDILSIPRKKLEHRRKSKHKPFYEYYDENTSNLVYEMFKNDFKYLNYDKNSWKNET